MTSKSTDIVVAEEKQKRLAIYEKKKDLVSEFGKKRYHDLLEDIGPIHRLALSRDDRFIAGAASETVCIWDTQTYRRVDRQAFDFTISAIALGGNGQTLYVGDGIRNGLWSIDLRNGQRERVFGTASPVVSLDLCSTDDRLVAGTYDGNIHGLDVVEWSLQFTVDCDGFPKRVLVAVDDESFSVETPTNVCRYSLPDGRPLADWPIEGDPATQQVSGNVPLVASAFSGVRMIDPFSGQCTREIRTFCTSMDHNRDTSIIVTANRAGATVWNGRTGQRKRRIPTYVHGPADLKISSEGRSMYICGGDSTIDHYALAGSRYGTLADVYCPIMAAAQTGDQLIVVDQRGVIAQYDLRSGMAQRFDHHSSCVSKMHVLGDLVATGSYDGTAKVLDISSGEVICCIRHRGVPVQAVALDTNGMLITGTRSGILRRYKISDGKLVREYHGNTAAIRCTAISPCGRYVLSATDEGDVLVFDYDSGDLLNHRSDFGLIYSACFDADGNHLFYGSGNGYVVKLASASGKIIARWRQHTSNVRSVALCQGSVVSIGIFDDACVANPDTGTPSLECSISSALYRRLAFINEDRTRLVTGGQDGRLRFHDLKNGSVVAELHNLDHGFLWTTNYVEEEADTPAWFWTDRDEMIQVHEQLGSTECLIPPGDDRHREYVQTNNSKIATMSRVGMCAEAIKRDVAGLCQSFQEKLKLENQQALLNYSPTDEG